MPTPLSSIWLFVKFGNCVWPCPFRAGPTLIASMRLRNSLVEVVLVRCELVHTSPISLDTTTTTTTEPTQVTNPVDSTRFQSYDRPIGPC